MSQAMRLENQLKPGNYTVKYRIDFQDGTNATEGVTDLVVKAAVTQIAAGDRPVKKP
jgi:methionine-rich copper-binding protein CopC